MKSRECLDACEKDTRGYCTCGYEWWASQQHVFYPGTSVMAPGMNFSIPTGFFAVIPKVTITPTINILPKQLQPFTSEQALGWTP